MKLRIVGELATDDETLSFWGEGNMGIDEAEVPRGGGGVLGIAVAGRERDA